MNRTTTKARRAPRGGWVVAALLSLLSGTPVHGQVSPPGTSATVVSGAVTGVVRARLDDRVRILVDASVEVRTADGFRTVRSDAAGRYHVVDLPPGPARLRVTHVGHLAVEVTVRVPAGGILSVDLELTAAPLLLPGVRVEATTPVAPRRGMLAEDVEGPADPVFELRTLELSPGVVEAGLLDAVSGMPGNDPADPSDVLFMRGSTTDMKLVLLDGIPVYAPFHVGGLLRSFEPSMLESADYHVGGAPARYDGGLTHVLDLRTRTARRDRARGSATVDLLSTALALEQPLGTRAGLLVSTRALHDAGTGLLGGGRSPYAYRDVLTSLDLDVTENVRLRGTGFWNEESVVLDYPGGPEDAAWGNRAFSLAWSGRLGGAELQATAGASRYDARLPLRPTPTQDDPDPVEILATAHNERARLVLESAWRDRAMPIRVGFSIEDQQVAYDSDRVDGSARLARAGSRGVLAGYVDADRTLVPGVTIRGGLRADLFEGDAPRFSPRASLAFEVGPQALFTVAAGRYHQMTRLPVEADFDQSVEQFAQQGGLAETLPVASADHLVVTLDQRLSDPVSLGLGGYFKRFTGIAADEQTIRNSGLDLQLVAAGERGALWLGYGLSWFWSGADFSGRSDDFVGRHLITTGVSGRLAGPIRIESRLSYGAGLPSTGIPFGSNSETVQDAGAPDPGAGPDGPRDQLLSGDSWADVPEFLLDESFLRLDIELHTRLDEEWLGRQWRVRPYLRVINALDRRDALFYSWQPWRSDEVTPLAVRPLLPVFGISIAW